MQIDTMIPGNFGFRPRDEKIWLNSHGAVTAGVIYTLDMTTATAANYGVVTDSAAASIATKEEKIHILALMSVTAADERCQFLVIGWADALAGGTTITANTSVTSNASGALIAAAVGYKNLGIAPEAITNATQGEIWFDGTGGLGATHSIID